MCIYWCAFWVVCLRGLVVDFTLISGGDVRFLYCTIFCWCVALLWFDCWLYFFCLWFALICFWYVECGCFASFESFDFGVVSGLWAFELVSLSFPFVLCWEFVFFSWLGGGFGFTFVGLYELCLSLLWVLFCCWFWWYEIYWFWTIWFPCYIGVYCLGLLRCFVRFLACVS